jgi:hypothetical protein
VSDQVGSQFGRPLPINLKKEDTTMGLVATMWARFLDATGLGPSMEERLNMAAEQSRATVGLKKELAGSQVALARTKRRELDDAVREYENLRGAGIQLQNEGKTETVNLIAVKMTALDQQIGQLISEVESLNAAASQAVNDYQNEAAEVEKLLSQHGQVLAAARMNTERKKLEKEMKALGGLSTARGTYKAIVSEVEVQTQTFRATAELESGGAAQDAQIRRALLEANAQQTLRMIQQQAASPNALPEPVSSTMDRARKALAMDPVYGALPMRVVETPAESEVIDVKVVEKPSEE